MQAVLNSQNINNDNELKLDNLIKMLSSADVKTKSDIENSIVNMGDGVANLLVDRLQMAHGVARGIIGMCLIRLGESSINPLRNLAQQNKDFQWVANYLISEI